MITNSTGVSVAVPNLITWLNGMNVGLTASLTDTAYNEILIQTTGTGGYQNGWTVQYAGQTGNCPISDKYFRGGLFQGDLLTTVTGYNSASSTLTLAATTIAQNGVNGSPANIFQGTGYTVGNLLYVKTVTSGTVQCGLYCTGGTSNYTYVHRQMSGTTGGVGVYSISYTQNVGSSASPIALAQTGFAQSSMGTDNWASIQNAINLASCQSPNAVFNDFTGSTTDYLQCNVHTSRGRHSSLPE